MAFAMSMALVSTAFAGCGNNGGSTGDGEAAGSPTEGGKVLKTISDIDAAALKGTTVTLYTHMGNRVLGEEKKDENGNTYRDENYAYLKHLAEQFEKEYEIHIDLQVNSTEDDIRPLLQTADPSIDIYTSPNWKIEEWQQYAEPYCTLEEAKEW